MGFFGVVRLDGGSCGKLHSRRGVLIQAACPPGNAITQAEARSLALDATHVGASRKTQLRIESADEAGAADAWTFFSRRRNDPGVQSSLVGWLSSDKRSAVMTDPVSDGLVTVLRCGVSNCCSGGRIVSNRPVIRRYHPLIRTKTSSRGDWC
jgi:hypothetical protein